jgi:hypothetical protein
LTSKGVRKEEIACHDSSIHQAALIMSARSQELFEQKIMSPLLAKTFGGLSRAYYFRQFVFGLSFAVFFFFIASRSPHAMPLGMAVFLVANTLLYPYARFVYEGVINFLLGENRFYVNAILMLFVKLLTMLMCWAFAIFIAPVGLIYLYVHHSRAMRQN